MQFLRTFWLSFVLVLACVLARGAAGAAQDLSKEEKNDGFVSLFNGTDLDGWIGDIEFFGAYKGILFCHPKKMLFKNLFSKKTYGDFILRLDYNVSENNNNGIGIRADPKMTGANTAQLALEIQIADEVWAKSKGYKDNQKTGSIYGLAAAEQGVQKEPDVWNSMEINAQGKVVIVSINGQKVADTSTILDTPAGKTHAGLKRIKGHIALLAHTNRTNFKNIRIKDLTIKELP